MKTQCETCVGKDFCSKQVQNTRKKCKAYKERPIECNKEDSMCQCPQCMMDSDPPIGSSEG